MGNAGLAYSPKIPPIASAAYGFQRAEALSGFKNTLHILSFIFHF